MDNFELWSWYRYQQYFKISNYDFYTLPSIQLPRANELYTNFKFLALLHPDV